VLWSAATSRNFRFAETSPPDVGTRTDVVSPARAESKAVTCLRSPHAKFAPSRGLDLVRSGARPSKIGGFRLVSGGTFALNPHLP
jgi:hypothetical protein